MRAIGLLREILVVTARPDLAVGVHPCADKVRQFLEPFSGYDAAVGEVRGCRIHAGGSGELFTQGSTGLE
jgi:hypothetical protein